MLGTGGAAAFIGAVDCSLRPVPTLSSAVCLDGRATFTAYAILICFLGLSEVIKESHAFKYISQLRPSPRFAHHLSFLQRHRILI